MYLVVLTALVGCLSYLMWQLAHTTPRALVMLFPPRLFYIFGVFLLVLGVFMACFSAYVHHDGSRVLQSLIQLYGGVWWILPASAGSRGSYQDERMLRRIFVMLGLLVSAILATVFIPDVRHVALVNLLLVTGGFCVATNYLRDLDRGR